MLKTLISHPTGNQNVRAAVRGGVDAGIITAFHTCVATFPGDILDYVSTLGPFSEISRRRLDIKLKPVTKMWPWLEVGRLIASKTGFHPLTKHEHGHFCIDAVYANLDKRVASTLKQAAKNGTGAVYAYEDGAYFSFRKAKSIGIQCLYDLPIGYWRTAQQIMQAEQGKWPAWAATLNSIRNSEAKLKRKDDELRMADRIFVASQFTAKTLQDFPAMLPPIEVIPYGFPPVTKINRNYYSSSSRRPLKLLFVGGLSQRKGIANLFAAVEALGQHVELTIVGKKAGSSCPALDAALKKHRWIPSLPHAGVLKLMREHDVLVFPSLFEGFGLVITEAMSQGTPVITTDRTAGPDLINHGENGWLIEAGSVKRLQAAIEVLLSQPKTVADAGRAARETAEKRPWSRYGQELAEAIQRHASKEGKTVVKLNE